VVSRRHTVRARARRSHGPGKLVAVNGATRILTCPLVCLQPGQAACGRGGANLKPREAVHAGARWQAWAWLGGLTRFDALIASHRSNPLPRAKAANGVTGYDQATLIPVGRVGLGKDLEPGRCTMPTPPPRHLASRPRHLPASRWPWRLGLVAFGLTTAVLAALVASATLLPQPPRGAPGLALPSVPAEPAPRPAPTPPTGPRAPTTVPTRPAPTPAAVPRAVSRATSAPGTATAPQAPATAATTTTTEAFSTVGATTQPPVAAPTTAATTTAAPTTTLATTTSTQPTTTGPTTTSAEPTTTTGPAVP
jgi:hypothetical protein